MDWSEIGKSIIKLGAPLLGTVIAGPAGGAMGALIASTFGANPEDPQDVINKMSGDPDAAIKLIQIQSDNKVELGKLAIQKLRIEQDAKELSFRDVKDARKQAANELELGKKDPMRNVMAFLVTITFVSMIGLFVFVKIDMSVKEILILLMGSLATQFADIVRFYFGSSAGSKKKDDIIRSQKL